MLFRPGKPRGEFWLCHLAAVRPGASGLRQLNPSTGVITLEGKVCGTKQLLDVIVLFNYSLIPLSLLLGNENGSFFLPISFIQPQLLGSPESSPGQMDLARAS